jgi:hypothetical protein
MRNKLTRVLCILLAVSTLLILAACASKPKFTLTNVYATGVYHGEDSKFFRLEDLNINGTYDGEKLSIPGKQAFMEYEIVRFTGDIGTENAAGGAEITNFTITLKEKNNPNAQPFEVVMNAGDSFRLLDPSFPSFVFDN